MSALIDSVGREIATPPSAARNGAGRPIVAVIQARTGSERLPGKVLMDVAGHPLLARVIERVKRAREVDRIVVAIPSGPADDPLAELAGAMGAETFRGSEDDVLDRSYRAALACGAGVALRICSDNPLVDPEVADLVVRHLLQGEYDLVRSRGYPLGLNVEAATFAALERAWRDASRPHEREHVMPYLYEHPDRFRIGEVSPGLDWSYLRWTVDTADDLAFVRAVYERLAPVEEFGWRDVLSLLRREPALLDLNRAVRQKSWVAGPSLLLRADATPAMGTGHVMRCLALAQAWQHAGGTAHLASASLPNALAGRLREEGIEPYPLAAHAGSDADAAETAALAGRLEVGWVVVDGYQFGSAYQQAIQDLVCPPAPLGRGAGGEGKGAAREGTRLLCIDDHGHAGHYSAEAVLNQNIWADEALYSSRVRAQSSRLPTTSASSVEPTRLLLGTRYVLLRREFWLWRGHERRVAADARRILVTLGGSDPDNVTLKALQALEQVKVEGLEVSVLVGGANPHTDALRAAVDGLGFGVQLSRNAANVAERMAWADLAITAGGTSCWEAAFMGLPSVMVVLAENQRATAEGLAAAGAAVSAGWHTNVTAGGLAAAVQRLLGAVEVRAAMSRAGRALVDGLGGERVVRELVNWEGRRGDA